MRILLINYEYPPVGGGAATATAAIARELAQLGHSPVVLTNRVQGLPVRTTEDNVLVCRIGLARQSAHRSNLFEMLSFLIAALFRAPGVAREQRCNTAIVFFSLPCGPIGLLLRRLYGIPFVISLRGGDVPGNEPALNWLHRLLTPLRRLVLKSAVAVVANSEGLSELAQKTDHVRTTVIPNGVDTDYFKPVEGPAKRPNELVRILFVGRLRKQKNVSFLLEQLARFDFGRFELQVVGDGPERSTLVARAESLGISQSVVWHGWVGRADLRHFYQEADCLVNVSLYEGMSNVMLEAMASSLPIIAADVPGNRSVIEHGVTGLLFNLSEPEQFGAVLEQLFNDQFAAELGQRARQYAVEKFSWRAVATSYVGLFNGKSAKGEP